MQTTSSTKSEGKSSKRKKSSGSSGSLKDPLSANWKPRERSGSNTSRESVPLLSSVQYSDTGDRLMREIYTLRLSRISLKLTISLIVNAMIVVALLAVLAIAISLLIYLVLYPYHNYFNETFTIDRNHVIASSTIVSTINGVIRQGLASYVSDIQFYPAASRVASCDISADHSITCNDFRANNSTINSADMVLLSDDAVTSRMVIYSSGGCIYVLNPAKATPTSFCVPNVTGLTIYHSQQIQMQNQTVVAILFATSIENQPQQHLNLISAKISDISIDFDTSIASVQASSSIVYATFTTISPGNILVIYRAKSGSIMDEACNVQLFKYIGYNNWRLSSKVTVADSSLSAGLAAATSASAIVVTESYIHNVNYVNDTLVVVDSQQITCPVYPNGRNRRMNKVYNIQVATSCAGTFIIACRAQLLAGYISFDSKRIVLAPNGFATMTSLQVDTDTLKLTSSTLNLGCQFRNNCSQVMYGVTFKAADGSFYSMQCSVYQLTHITCSRPYKHLYSDDTLLTTVRQKPTYAQLCQTEISLVSLVQDDNSLVWQFDNALWYGGITIAGISTQEGANFDDNSLQNNLPSAIKIAQKGVIVLHSNPANFITGGSKLYAHQDGTLTNRITKTSVGFAMSSTQLIIDTTLVFPSDQNDDDNT